MVEPPIVSECLVSGIFASTGSYGNSYWALMGHTGKERKAWSLGVGARGQSGRENEAWGGTDGFYPLIWTANIKRPPLSLKTCLFPRDHMNCMVRLPKLVEGLLD